MLNSDRNLEWLISKDLIPYSQALSAMKAHVEAQISAYHQHQITREKVWLLEHPPLYTAGLSANLDEVLDATRFPIYKTGRGGKMTYHGPGQRVAYLMLDLNQRGRDVRHFVFRLEEWLIQTLAAFDVIGARRPDQPGIWVGDDKIAAIGIRLRHWISSHGISINLAPDLEHFSGIIPCGLTKGGITSLHALGCKISMEELDQALKLSFQQVFQTP